MEKAIIEAIVLHLEKNVRNVAGTIISSQYVKVVNSNTRDSSQSRPKKKGHKGKKFHKVTEDQNGSMDDLADQVQSLFYHDIHFNTVNTHMHTRLKCEMPHGLKSKETFKIDTGTDSNLIPITDVHVTLFPNISLETLG